MADKSGFTAGVEWAKWDAKGSQLVQLEALVEMARSRFLLETVSPSDLPFIRQAEDPDPYMSIFGEYINEVAPTPEYVASFARGALSIWKQAKA
jgi:hypothetical protein